MGHWAVDRSHVTAAMRYSIVPPRLPARTGLPTGPGGLIIVQIWAGKSTQDGTQQWAKVLITWLVCRQKVTKGVLIEWTTRRGNVAGIKDWPLPQTFLKLQVLVTVVEIGICHILNFVFQWERHVHFIKTHFTDRKYCSPTVTLCWHYHL